jgi:hypothetical protein
VHGLAKLLIDGPLGAMDDEQADDLVSRLLEMLEKGI